MKNDLISRSALGIGKAKRECFEDPKYADGWNSAVEIINTAPAVDAVEVVRCKDCKHYGWGQEPSHGRTIRYCNLHKGLVVVGNETFCSYGERRAKDGK